MAAEMIKQIRASLTGVTVDENGSLQANCSFGPEFCGFAGHFPGAPILPALVQLLVARELIASMNGPVEVEKVRGAKFKRPLQPGEQIEICCRPQSEGNGYKVELKSGGELASSLTLVCR